MVRIRVTAIRNMPLRRAAIVCITPLLFCITFPLALAMNVLHLLETAREAWTRREPLPPQCEVGIVGDAVIVRMPIDLLAHVANLAPCIHHLDPATIGTDQDFHVTEPRVFADSVKRALLRELDESGLTLVHEMFDNAIERVIDDGEEGFAWPAAGIR